MNDELGTSMLSIRHKIVFVGNPCSGKTSLMNKIVNNEFKEVYDQTIGVDFFTKVISYKETIFKLQLWDSAGQEKYKSLIPSYVRGASLVFIIYDIANEESFNAVPNWINFIKQSMEVSTTKLILIGNKIDLNRVVKSAKGSSLAKKEGMLFFETSAKTGEGVNEMFYNAIAELNFFDDIRKIDDNIVKDLMEQNIGGNNAVKNSILEPSTMNSKLNIQDSNGNPSQTKDIEETKKKCGC